MAFVELDSLTKRYGALTVVNGVDLAIYKGKLVCLLGPSGCGKTTTLRLIAGFVQPTDGRIRVGGKVISSASGLRNPATSRSVVVLPQPEGPSSATSSPGFTWRSRALTAATSP